ncbi:hypothetical protein E5D57_000810 [Metarhizium anisopliae]|nr:hypothetical protein E5D57_000810 [Metarhizium anisopliae]
MAEFMSLRRWTVLILGFTTLILSRAGCFINGSPPTGDSGPGSFDPYLTHVELASNGTQFHG